MLLLAFTIVSFMGTLNASAKTIVTDGLVSYWTFDAGTIRGNTVEDVWGENDATIFGNPKRAQGQVKGGIELDGAGDYVSIPNFGNFGSRLGPYTFEAWFKTSYKRKWSAIYEVNELPCGRRNKGQGILLNAIRRMGFDDIIDTREDFILVFRLHKVGAGGCAGTSSGRELIVSNGEWHHIVQTSGLLNEEEIEQLNQFPGHRPGGNCTSSGLYFDKEELGKGFGCIFPNDIRPYTEPIFLGAVNQLGKPMSFFEGVFDEVRIYDRVLTHEEVIRNYESGIGLGVEAAQKLPTVWGTLKETR